MAGEGCEEVLMDWPIRKTGMADTDWRRQGAAHFLGGRMGDAALAFEKALSGRPDDPDALSGLALVRLRQGRLEEAADAFEEALRLRPIDAGSLVNLGNIEVRRKREAVAEVCYRRALEIAPDCVEAWNGLGNICQAYGRFLQAQQCYQKVLESDARHGSAANNLGNLYQKNGRLAAAEACYRRALSVCSQDPEVLSNLGQCLRSQGRLTEALAAIDSAFQQYPRCAEAHNHRGLILQDYGRIDEAIQAFNKAESLSPDNAAFCSNRLFAMQYDWRTTSGDLLHEARKWWTRYGTGVTQQPLFEINPDPFRKLRIGFMSGDFRSHSVGFFLMQLFACYDRHQLEIHCYSEVENPDEITDRCRQLVLGWQRTVGMGAAAVSERIRADRIDILIDLAGHTANNRLDVFALAPAPIQMTWLGYPGTTGSPVIDYRITDGIADPPGESDNWHSERLIRLPTGFLCYSPPEEAPPVEESPVYENGHITFGSFNTLPKLNYWVIETWATLLHRIPESRLVIKCKQLADADTCQRLRDRFAKLGLPTHRIHLMSKVPSTKEHLSVYHKVDIALDPFPYNGTTTTCEALWMGVPVVTLLGDRHSGRVGATILSGLKLKELIAEDRADYMTRAMMLATDRERLTHLRWTLRQRMMGSPLCDGSAFSQSFGGMLRKIWIDWCRDQILRRREKVGTHARG